MVAPPLLSRDISRAHCLPIDTQLEAAMPRRQSLLLLVSLAACQPRYDVVIRGGTVYDGSGSTPTTGDVALQGDSIVAVGAVSGRGRTEVDAKGLAVAPGFI